MTVSSEASQFNATKRCLVDGLNHPAQSDSVRLFVPPCFIIDHGRSIIDNDDHRGPEGLKLEGPYLFLYIEFKGNLCFVTTRVSFSEQWP